MRSTGLPMRRRRPAAGHWRFRCTARLPKSLCQRSACRFPPSQPTSNASSAISPRTAITGEFTLSDPGVRLLLRLDGQVIFRSSAPTDHIDDIWLKAADAVMREISPYRAALALYDSDPDEAIRFASSIIRRHPPGDENVAWARLIRGARHIDFMQYSAAEKEFREVLLHAEGTSLASSSMPFSAPASYT